MRAIVLGLTVLAAPAVRAQPASTADPATELGNGKTFLATPVFSEEEDRGLL